jgi:hypothetical protein
MADETRSEPSGVLEPVRRYVPLAVWTVAILVILIIPLKIVSYGFLPYDDALGDAAKAVCGRPWPDIVVMGSSFKMDHHFGWHWLLREVYLWTHCNTDTLVTVEVVALFLASCGAGLLLLKRPEAWLATLVIFFVWSGLLQRVAIGRQLVLTMTSLMIVLFAWHRHGTSPPKWGTLLWLTALLTVTFFLHGVWYLWALPVAAFFLAGEFRWGFQLAVSAALAVLFSAVLTGHPVEIISQTVTLALRVEGIHATQSTRVHEMRPATPEIIALFVLGGLVVLRRLARLDLKPLSRTPAFWLALMGWILGCQTWRFWEDWGLPALVVLVACNLQSFFQTRLAEDSLKRLAIVCGLAVTVYAAGTNDFQGRWTHNLRTAYLTQDNPDLKGWLPDKNGIIYSADMTIFFQTFYKNPSADWRYILGFEPAYMPDADFKVYHAFLVSNGDAKTLAPWVDKMRPADRFVTRAPRNAPPDIPRLEWYYGVSDIWIGRLPRPVAPGTAPPTIPAKVGAEISTNAVPSAAIQPDRYSTNSPPTPAPSAR